jgi:hypothetical protein
MYSFKSSSGGARWPPDLTCASESSFEYKSGGKSSHRRNSNQRTPWTGVRLEKLTVSQLVKTLLIFYGNQTFITIFTNVCHWTLSQASWIQFTASY